MPSKAGKHWHDVQHYFSSSPEFTFLLDCKQLRHLSCPIWRKFKLSHHQKTSIRGFWPGKARLSWVKWMEYQIFGSPQLIGYVIINRNMAKLFISSRRILWACEVSKSDVSTCKEAYNVTNGSYLFIIKKVLQSKQCIESG